MKEAKFSLTRKETEKRIRSLRTSINECNAQQMALDAFNAANNSYIALINGDIDTLTKDDMDKKVVKLLESFNRRNWVHCRISKKILSGII
jgi:hypothetical protein